MGLSVIHWSVECEMRSVVYGSPIEEEGENERIRSRLLDRLNQKNP